MVDLRDFLFYSDISFYESSTLFMKNIKAKITTIIKPYINNKKLLYFFNGSIIFIINLILAYFIVKIPFSDTPRIQNNIANVITTELMVFISFFIHDNFTWKGSTSSFMYKIIRYHSVMLASIIIRFFSFMFFDFLHFPFMISTVLSILIIVIFNFIGFDKFVFHK